MEKEKIWYLKRLKLFEGPNAEVQIRELDKIAHHKQYKNNQTVFLPGDRRRLVYLLKKGHIKLCRISPQGKSLTVALLEPGEIFGEIEALDNRPTASVAESLNALEPVTVCEIEHKDYVRYLHQFPEIAIKVLMLVGARARQMEARMEDLAFKSVSSRLANLFIELSEKYGQESPDGFRISVRLTHQNLADLVGANRETVTSFLSEFRREGLITQNKGYFFILEKDKLNMIR
ncbi:MAG: Crp/Fnr family transcriptional regulator [Nitrospirales bacterium]